MWGMSSTRAPAIDDPLKLVNTLDANAIASRLEELDAERAALRVLLRSARARETAARRREKAAGEEGHDAS
jgi:hypothetical protein